MNEVDVHSKAGLSSLDTVMTSPGQEESDYVWDVFYHRPVSLAEWNELAANIGTLYASFRGNGGFPDSLVIATAFQERTMTIPLALSRSLRTKRMKTPMVGSMLACLSFNN